MKLYQEMLSRFMASPPLLKNLPSASSSMYWLCGFQQQLLVLAKQIQCFSSEMLATDNGWTARDRLGRLSKDTERFFSNNYTHTHICMLLCLFQYSLYVYSLAHLRTYVCTYMVYIIGLTHWTYIEVLLQISFCSCINSVKQKWISSVPTNLLDCLRTPVLVSVG